MKQSYKVRVPWFQPYSVVREVLKVYEGVSWETIKSFIKTIKDLTGTPQANVDWSQPDEWIDARLSGGMAALARRFWDESNHRVNPRYLHGPDYLIRLYSLAEPDAQGLYRVTDLGQRFIDNAPSAIRHIDESEGTREILQILSARVQGRFADLYPEWSLWVRKRSKFQADASLKAALRGRLRDLIDRGLVQREGHVYSLTSDGATWVDGDVEPDPAQVALRAVKQFNDGQRETLRKLLSTMNPYRFEQLVGQLLEAMGYDDVQVTKQSGDKGIDVVATIQFGITEVTEVVQVKRHQGSISRSVLDQLRGALHYFNAIRGTIITVGKFSKGCKDAALHPGAAPISLIDGDRLLDLLQEHRIGLKERSATLLEVDALFFDETQESESEDDDD